MPAPALALHDIHLTWPDGNPAFAGLDLQIPPGRSGLVGANGTGKTTLLKLLGRELQPQHGAVTAPPTVALLPQDLALHPETRVDAHLGLAERRAAIAAIEAGDTDPALFDVVGDDWNVEDRVIAGLARLGLPADILERRLGELSGGECTSLALAGLLLQRPDVLLLDEPTNNLDRLARERLHDLVAGYRGTLVVVSHDRELLEHVDRIGELRADPGRTGTHRVSWYGGGWSDYVEQVAVEQQAAEQAVTTARSEVRREKKELATVQVALARRKRYGQKMYETKREPRAVMKLRKSAAQESAAKHRAVNEDRLAQARSRLDEAHDRLRVDEPICVDLPRSAVPAGREVLVLSEVELRTGALVDLELRGPERVAVTGPNGSGKTTLLHTALGLLPPGAGTVDLRVPSRLLPQRLDVLDPDRTVAENAATFAPGTEPTILRAQLARFLFRGTAADRPVGVLSGGELFRATLACLLLAEPAPQLLVLDEPTNNLDLVSAGQLVSALASYDGALLVASHDETFLADLGVQRRIELGRPVRRG